MIDFSIDKFIAKVPDPFSEKIEDAHQAMSSVTVQNRIIVYPNSVKLDFVDNDLNNGELTDRGIKNCKSTEYKICIHPDVTHDFEYVYPSKAEILPTNCESKFEDTVNNNIDNLDFQTPDTKVLIEPKLVETKVDVNDETICSTSNVANSNSCDCIKWACPAAQQVVVGDSTLITLAYIKQSAKENDLCADCYGIETDDEGIQLCIQYSGKICKSGTPQDGNCLVQIDPNCPDGMSLNGDTDKCEVDPSCSAGNYDTGTDDCRFDTQSACPDGFIVVSCFGEEPPTCICSGIASCPAGDLNTDTDKCESNPTCSTGSYKPATNYCEKTIPKECPDGTEEYKDESGDYTGRCYKENPGTPICDLHKTLYSKTCNYNYQASAAALVNVKDKDNKYPVYDSVEKKTDIRNLELQFYILSKN